MFKLLTHKSHRNFQRLWIAQLISQFGDRIHQLALVGLIAERAPGSAMNLAKLIAFTIIPVFLIQPIAGVFVDRWDRKTTLFVCDLARGCVVLLIPFLFIEYDSMIPIYCIVFLVFSFSRFYVPAKMSIIPDLVDEYNIIQANSLVTTTGMIAFVLGAALGGFYVEAHGSRNGFILDAGTFFASAAFLFSMRIPKEIKRDVQDIKEHKDEIQSKIKGSIWQEMVEGFRYLKNHTEIRFVVSMMFVLLAAAGSVYVVIIVFIQESFQTVTKDLGILAICLGVGCFLGVLIYGKIGKKERWMETIYVCLFGGGLMLMIFAAVVHFWTNLWVAMALSVMWGMVIGPVFIASNAVVQLVSSEEMRGKVFSALEIVIHLAFLLAMFISSWLSGLVGSVWILVGVGAIIMCVALLGGMSRWGKGGIAISQD